MPRSEKIMIVKVLVVIAIIAGVCVGVKKGLEFYERYQYQEQQVASVLIEQQQLQNEIESIKATFSEQQRAAIDAIQNVKDAALAEAVKTNEAIKKNAPVDYSAIIAEWQNKIVSVLCKYSNADETPLGTSQGSATLMSTSYGITAVTNAHVQEKEKGVWPAECTLTNALGAKSIAYSPAFFLDFSQSENKADVAYIKIDTGIFDTAATAKTKICKDTDATLGDKIIILGYPKNGSKSTLTATQGVVSGFDGNYIVTDAKIDKGDSGGAAILLKNDCYLGIPTAAIVGAIESYGRILKSSLVVGR